YEVDEEHRPGGQPDDGGAEDAGEVGELEALTGMHDLTGEARSEQVGGEGKEDDEAAEDQEDSEHAEEGALGEEGDDAERDENEDEPDGAVDPVAETDVAGIAVSVGDQSDEFEAHTPPDEDRRQPHAHEHCEQGAEAGKGRVDEGEDRGDAV